MIRFFAIIEAHVNSLLKSVKQIIFEMINVQDETVTEDTECWICHRKVREVLDKVLDIWGSGDEVEDY